ncbi:uncharacterized protein [Coffea arabica]|uniref:MULE transposase domain-containing protein n=1 Tax=Coffea arabica TaxID=13443 RepID=A0A6P6U942_COFAR|nr:uncharacterized protein LOC113708493 [Coffea arabica]
MTLTDLALVTTVAMRHYWMQQARNEPEVSDTLAEDVIPDHLSSDGGSSEEDEDGDQFQRRYKDFCMEKFKIDTRFELGMKFGSRAQFKAAVQEYGIKMGKPVYTKRNESNQYKRVRAKCKAPCQWFVFASIEKALGSTDLVVKSMNDKHENCNHAWKNKNLKSKWLSDRWIAAKSRKLALEMIKGSAEQQYKRIWEYCAEIKKTHEGSTMEDNLRPLIALDGCHLKGTYRGQLLTAIAVDPNNGWWPIAWTVVEREATEQWAWFLKYLNDDLEIENQFHYTFISDQQKGLDRALAEVLSNCEHRYCVQHMYRNFKKKHPGLPLKDRLWNIANSTIKELYNKAMKELKDFDNEAYQWVKKCSSSLALVQGLLSDSHKE